MGLYGDKNNFWITHNKLHLQQFRKCFFIVIYFYPKNFVAGCYCDKMFSGYSDQPLQFSHAVSGYEKNFKKGRKKGSFGRWIAFRTVRLLIF